MRKMEGHWQYLVKDLQLESGNSHAPDIFSLHLVHKETGNDFTMCPSEAQICFVFHTSLITKFKAEKNKLARKLRSVTELFILAIHLFSSSGLIWMSEQKNDKNQDRVTNQKQMHRTNKWVNKWMDY